MNTCYRVVWNESTQTWQVVSENARYRGGSPAKSVLAAAVFNLGATFGGVAIAADLPSGGQITFGAGSIQQSQSQLTINQSSERMALDWKSFSVGADKSVRFVQPSTSATAINRVTGIDASVIAGKLHANGTVVLINPNGVLFTPTAEINVGSLVASTLKTISNDFSSNQLSLEGDSKAAVINQGRINTLSGGTVAFVAAQVKNLGEINAPSGKVSLVAGGKVKIDFGGPVDLEIEKGIIDAYVEQGGIIRATGGRILLAAKTLNQLMHTVVNHTGISEAKSARMINGEIVLDGGTDGAVQVAGTLDVSGKTAGETGGQLKIFGRSIVLKDTAVLGAQGDNGGGNIFVGGGWQGQSVDGRASAEQVRIDSGALLDASALVSGNGGTIVAWSDISNPSSLTEVYGTLLSRGGKDAGNGGRIETSGYRLIVDGITVNAAGSKGAAGEWLLDPYDIKIENVTETPNLIQSGTDPKTISPPSNTTIIKPSTIMEALKNSNVTITTGSNGSQAGDITVVSQVIQPSYSISVNGTQTTQQFQLPSERTLTLKAARSIIFNDGTGIDATLNQNTQKLNVVLWADSDASGGGNVVMKGSSAAGVTIRTRGGGLWIGGGSESATNNWAPSGTTTTTKVGVGPAEGYIDSSVSDFKKSMGVSMDFTTITTGSGNVTIVGRGSNSADGYNKGIRLFESAIETDTGAIALRGRGGGDLSSSGGHNTGIYVYKHASSANTSVIPTLQSNSGTILIDGLGGNTNAISGANNGVSLIGD
ncbi:MAG: filamentous hemagglutinin N-terminal domain-containing protein, partial [Gammaproteobacteria bacterium]|nr:filamentous hemagglutinin N-terminal domain-containing protein [Gammaproteobacteria bacterium]